MSTIWFTHECHTQFFATLKRPNLKFRCSERTLCEKVWKFQVCSNLTIFFQPQQCVNSLPTAIKRDTLHTFFFIKFNFTSISVARNEIIINYNILWTFLLQHFGFIFFITACLLSFGIYFRLNFEGCENNQDYGRNQGRYRTKYKPFSSKLNNL